MADLFQSSAGGRTPDRRYRCRRICRGGELFQSSAGGRTPDRQRMGQPPVTVGRSNPRPGDEPPTAHDNEVHRRALLKVPILGRGTNPRPRPRVVSDPAHNRRFQSSAGGRTPDRQLRWASDKSPDQFQSSAGGRTPGRYVLEAERARPESVPILGRGTNPRPPGHARNDPPRVRPCSNPRPGTNPRPPALSISAASWLMFQSSAGGRPPAAME